MTSTQHARLMSVLCATFVVISYLVHPPLYWAGLMIAFGFGVIAGSVGLHVLATRHRHRPDPDDWKDNWKDNWNGNRWDQ